MQSQSAKNVAVVGSEIELVWDMERGKQAWFGALCTVLKVGHVATIVYDDSGEESEATLLPLKHGKTWRFKKG